MPESMPPPDCKRLYVRRDPETNGAWATHEAVEFPPPGLLDGWAAIDVPKDVYFEFIRRRARLRDAVDETKKFEKELIEIAWDLAPAIEESVDTSGGLEEDSEQLGREIQHEIDREAQMSRLAVGVDYTWVKSWEVKQGDEMALFRTYGDVARGKASVVEGDFVKVTTTGNSLGGDEVKLLYYDESGSMAGWAVSPATLIAVRRP